MLEFSCVASNWELVLSLFEWYRVFLKERNILLSNTEIGASIDLTIIIAPKWMSFRICAV